MSLFEPWRRFLTWRYSLAMALAALVITLASWGLVTGIQREHDEYNVLSLARQQTADLFTTLYLANLSAYAQDPVKRNEFRDNLKLAIRRMEDRHAILSLESGARDVPGEMRDVLGEAYYGDRSVDRQMEAFFTDARELLDAGGELEDLEDLARVHTRLLPAHGWLHDRLAGKAEAAFERVKLFAVVHWLVAICALAAVIFLILGPAVRRTERILEDMRHAKIDAARRAEVSDAIREGQAKFIRTMNHELRTPLNAILGMAQLLQMRGLRAREEGYARDIQQAGDHLLGLINQVLDLSRIEARQVSLRYEPVALDALLAGVIQMLRPLADRKALTLNGHCDPALSGSFMADPGHVQQVLLNLAGNAINFTDAGRIDVRVVRAGRTAEDTEQVRFEVADTGTGIPVEQREHIFKEFQQADGAPAPGRQGTGLGLAICRGLVDLMGGTIGMESVVGSGSLFWFELPLKRVSMAGGEPVAASPERPAGDTADGHPDATGPRHPPSRPGPVREPLHRLKM